MVILEQQFGIQDLNTKQIEKIISETADYPGAKQNFESFKTIAREYLQTLADELE